MMQKESKDETLSNFSSDFDLNNKDNENSHVVKMYDYFVKCS